MWWCLIFTLFIGPLNSWKFYCRKNYLTTNNWMCLFSKLIQVPFRKHTKCIWSVSCESYILLEIIFAGKYESSPILKQHAGLGRRHFVLMGQSYQLLTDAVADLRDLRDLNDKNQQKLRDLSSKSKPAEVSMTMCQRTITYSMPYRICQYHCLTEFVLNL